MQFICANNKTSNITQEETMNISFETPDKINGLMTIVVEEADYKERVEKSLKDYRKRVNVPGFRPGKVPMGMVRKQFETPVKMEEINQILGEEINKYLQENKIHILGEPLASEKQEPQDLETNGPKTFMFDIAVAPEIGIELNKKDKVTMHRITVDDKLIDQQIEDYQNRYGHQDKAETYDPELKDLLKGELVELDGDGNVKEDGIKVESAIIMPTYIKVDEQQKLFDKAKLNDVIVFNPKKAYPDNDAEVASLLNMKKEEVAGITADFRFTINEISRHVKAEVNQELFDQVYADKKVADVETFRSLIKEDIAKVFESHSEFLFTMDFRKYLEEKAGDIKFPEELLKRFLKQKNKDKDDDFVEKHFQETLNDIKWQLIKDKLASDMGLKINNDDVMNTAKMAAQQQFAQYGMNNIPEEYIEKYAKDMLKNENQANQILERTYEMMVVENAKKQISIKEKEVSFDDFKKLAER